MEPTAVEILRTFATIATPCPAALRSALPLASYALSTPEGARSLGEPSVSRFILRLLETCQPREVALLAKSYAQGLFPDVHAFPAPSETRFTMPSRLAY